MIRFLLIIAVYLASVKAYATPIKLTLAINSRYSPHLYFDAAQKHYVGVIPDILTTAENDNAIEVAYVDSHRSRSETFVAEGQLDMFYSSLEWLDEPERFIATDPIFYIKATFIPTNLCQQVLGQTLTPTLEYAQDEGFTTRPSTLV